MNKDKLIKPGRITEEDYRKVMSDLAKHEKLEGRDLVERKRRGMTNVVILKH